MSSNLHCQANNCTYNNCGNCYASHIKIEGFEASITPETYCETFEKKSSNTFSNSVSDINLTNTQNISCSASMCTYNINGGCNANNVDINFENATCETFRLTH
ncbi:MAG: DUF1540 domain-containing protein [Peptostreptococcaceae bacterium]